METLKSFFAVQGDGNNMTYKEGWERIPENWYKTPVDYDLVQLQLDTDAFMLKYPELAR